MWWELAKTAIPVLISLGALGVSIRSLYMSKLTWKRTFRPMVSVAVKTHHADPSQITYDLVVINSGNVPARDIQLKPTSQEALEAALGGDASKDNKERWLAPFNQTIPLLLNGDRTTGSFGDTRIKDTGFWKYKSKFRISIRYTDWFAQPYEEVQDIYIFTSNTFTGYSWG